MALDDVRERWRIEAIEREISEVKRRTYELDTLRTMLLEAQREIQALCAEVQHLQASVSAFIESRGLEND